MAKKLQPIHKISLPIVQLSSLKNGLNKWTISALKESKRKVIPPNTRPVSAGLIFDVLPMPNGLKMKRKKPTANPKVTAMRNMLSGEYLDG